MTLIRPEWLFEVVNGVQGLVVPTRGSAEAQVLDALFAMFPAESDFEAQIREALVARLRVEQARLSACHGIASITGSAALREVTGRFERLDVVVTSAKRLLQSDPAARWTVDALARRVRCNRTDLEIGFRHRYSATVHSFHVVCRVEAAKALLRQTAWRVEEIAKGVGCRSKTSLFEHFSKVLQMTPGEYRMRWTLVAANQAVHALVSRCAPRAESG